MIVVCGDKSLGFFDVGTHEYKKLIIKKMSNGHPGHTTAFVKGLGNERQLHFTYRPLSRKLVYSYIPLDDNLMNTLKTEGANPVINPGNKTASTKGGVSKAAKQDAKWNVNLEGYKSLG